MDDKCLSQQKIQEQAGESVSRSFKKSARATGTNIVLNRNGVKCEQGHFESEE